MEEVSVQEDDKPVDHHKQILSEIADKDESGFGEDISACSLQDKTLNENMDTLEAVNHFTLEQCVNNKMLDVSQTDSSLTLRGMKKDDSGIFSEKSPSTTQTKESSDGEWSESVSESLEEANAEVKDQDNTIDDKLNEITESSKSVVKKMKNSDAVKDVEGNNVKTDHIEKMEEDLIDKMKVSGNDKDTVNDKNNKEKQDLKGNCDTSDIGSEKEQSESNNQQMNSDKCDNINVTNDDEDFAEFVRKTVKSRSHVRKLVDYDSDDSDDDSSIGSPVVVKGKRRYRKRKPETDSDEDTSTYENKEKEKESKEQNDGTPVLLRHSVLNESNEQNNVGISDLSTDSSDDSHHSPKTRHDSSSDHEPEDTPPDFSEYGPPKHKWRALFDLRKREFGYSTIEDQGYFRKKVQGSLQMVKRFDLQFKMDQHEGCVNALHFNRTGTLLASGSDDLNIVIWNWIHNRPALLYDSGHRSNVFQAKFMPFSGDCHVVSCARDGQVRLADLSSTGVCKGTKKVAQHRGAAHKLALEMDSPHNVLSAGEDAVTYEIDLRVDKPNKLVTTKENDKKVSIYSIHSNPVNSNEFCLGGRDHFVRVYDKRKINEEVNNGLLKKFAPHHILEAGNDSMKANVTCACYNYNGSEILGTYNDEDIYLFSNEHSDAANYIHKYRGHRNNQTVKGVNFYGPESEFIVSGSDCGHIFLWDKATENIVQYMEGDEGGVINVLEPHPYAPILATSGLDHDVKIWAPTAENPTNLKGLRKLIKRNSREREEERTSDGGMIDGSMLWFIMHHLRRGRRQRARDARAARGEPTPDGETSDTLSDEDLTTDEDSDSEGDGGAHDAISCNPS